MKIINNILLALLIMGFTLPCYAEKIIMEGSTTVLPIAQRIAEVYMKKNPNADISVRGGGSGVGIASLIDGTCHIANSSRPIRDSELNRAVMFGRNIKAHVIAMDGIAVIVHPSNKIKGLTKKQLKEIYTGKISNWSVIGGDNQKIVVISRDSASGTYEAFGELALDKEKVRPDAIMQASNQAIASTVARTPAAIGYVGLAFLDSNVKAIEIDGVIASKETVLNNSYPISRPLFMYTNGNPVGLVKEIIDFIRSPEGQQLIESEGYVGLR